MLPEVFKVRCIDNITIVFAYNQKPVLIIDYFFGHPVKVSKSLFMEIDEISCFGWMIKPFCKFVPRFRKNYRDTVKPYVVIKAVLKNYCTKVYLGLITQGRVTNGLILSYLIFFRYFIFISNFVY